MPASTDQSFINKPIDVQIHLALQRQDPQLLQLILGPRHFQLWHHWFSHAMILERAFSLMHMINAKLRLPLIQIQRKVLLPEVKKLSTWTAEKAIQGSEGEAPLDGKALLLALLKETQTLMEEKRKIIVSEQQAMAQRYAVQEPPLLANLSSSQALIPITTPVTPAPHLPPMPIGVEVLAQYDLAQECDLRLDELKAQVENTIIKHANWGTRLSHQWHTQTDSLQHPLVKTVMHTATPAHLQPWVHSLFSTLDAISRFLRFQEKVSNNLEDPQCLATQQSTVTDLLEALTQQERISIEENDRLTCQLVQLRSEILGPFRQSQGDIQAFSTQMLSTLERQYLRTVLNTPGHPLAHDLAIMDTDGIEKNLKALWARTKSSQYTSAIEAVLKSDLPLSRECITILLLNPMLLSHTHFPVLEPFKKQSIHTLMLQGQLTLFNFTSPDNPLFNLLARFPSYSGAWVSITGPERIRLQTQDSRFQELERIIDHFIHDLETRVAQGAPPAGFIETLWKIYYKLIRRATISKAQWEILQPYLEQLLNTLLYAIAFNDEAMIRDYLDTLAWRSSESEFPPELAPLHQAIQTHAVWWVDTFWNSVYGKPQWALASGPYQVQEFINTLRLSTQRDEEARTDQINQHIIHTEQARRQEKTRADRAELIIEITRRFTRALRKLPETLVDAIETQENACIEAIAQRLSQDATLNLEAVVTQAIQILRQHQQALLAGTLSDIGALIQNAVLDPASDLPSSAGPTTLFWQSASSSSRDETMPPSDTPSPAA